MKKLSVASIRHVGEAHARCRSLGRALQGRKRGRKQGERGAAGVGVIEYLEPTTLRPDTSLTHSPRRQGEEGKEGSGAEVEGKGMGQISSSPSPSRANAVLAQLIHLPRASLPSPRFSPCRADPRYLATGSGISSSPTAVANNENAGVCVHLAVVT